MARIHRLVGRMQAVMLVGALALLVLPSTPSVTASTMSTATPSLSLEPATGPPGTTVTAVASGYGDCPPVDDAVPGGVVSFVWGGRR